MIGRKASVGGFFKSTIKSPGSTLYRRCKQLSWSTLVGVGIFSGVGVKCVEAQQLTGHDGLKHSFGAGRESGTKSRQTLNTRYDLKITGGQGLPVRRWGISFIVERETARITG
ncbi:hypothetical protein LINPERHAP2_LOCUS16087 [Linum perenne]